MPPKRIPNNSFDLCVHVCLTHSFPLDLFFGGESQGVEQISSFTCPLCGQLGFSEPQLREHVTKQHADGTLQEVICPVCAGHPSGDPNHLTDDLPTHLTVEHRALREMEISFYYHDCARG